ncbi:MAG: YciI family protein [Actinomycetota bacterium]|nr:YciI family protein [Actinomycetota bacterium]
MLLGAEQLRDTDAATTLRLRGGDRLLTDGPFIETKEHLLGFYLLEVPDLDTALDWAQRMPLARYGAVELRPVAEGMPWRAALTD